MKQAWDLARLNYEPMRQADLPDVVALEESVYPHPWSLTNFVDSLNSNYEAWVLRDQQGDLLGYFLLMAIVDEAHLLNVAVSAERQGQGLGRFLLNQAVACARGLGMESVLLEVRPSNTRALEIYERYGFKHIGRRKGYYPAANQQREDAIVMRFSL
ncbi:ribosomal-protein-alanine N-acetyltransferase [Duganella sp. BJB488]|uniref:ribosomal protein S18-alanine N-acetyltransferase n=1 Tax=unclassified Duganella TaxID=2636909 RepID=UPI000E34F136|nr:MULTISPECIES: ribosomal protein S18-alanine N-acetyltransferase [unclassified Duganella]NVD75022.1 ribosomal protein S18-alanine N-acetyltransferase [Duganella sp. BJB1802]RFP15312.1 ribosomal-protein-alanine N-acetyltransferase [Duganella sp. BJB489]RFP19868.1 ribosomal-protein-alanine N-acetyltransferase [Duganella sp. BJB488]RFP38256.1 ribosomal-protein-alanine N-acetyltransferase [Duganella sp. BJB480]